MRDLWYKSAVVYGLDVETFADGNGDGIGDFVGLTSRLAYLAGLGVNCLWLLPFYPTPNRDNGYDITDYCSVDPRLGTLADFVQFTHEAEEYGIRVVVDLVLNHTSDQHPWFKSARSSRTSPYRDWYVWSDTKPPDADKGIVFPGVQKSIWSWDKQARAYYYHRFYEFQPDLNILNPAVREEFQRIMGLWLQLGVSGFRVDAAPFLIEHMGKGAPDQEHIDPFAHIEEMRDFLQWRLGDAVLLAEANVPMDTIGAYFGNGNRMHILYNFAVNRNLFLALAKGSSEPLVKALEDLPPLPETGQWGTFLRNADETDFSQLAPEDMALLLDVYGPDPKMRIFDRGVRRRLAPMLGGNPRRINLAFALMFGLPGTPVIYYGDEIGMGEDMSLPERNPVRTPMQWTGEANGGFAPATAKKLIRPVIDGGPYGYQAVNVAWSQRDPDSIVNHVEKLIRTYKQLPSLGWGKWRVLKTDAPTVLALHYEWRGERVMTLANVAEQPCTLRIAEGNRDPWSLREVIADGEYAPVPDTGQSILIEGYGYRWFRVGGEIHLGGRHSG